MTTDPGNEPHSAATVEVLPAEGPVRGALRDGVATFRGVPYAAPPVGRLRFAPPEPPARRQSTLDALRYGPISEQDLDPLPLAIPPTQENFFAAEATTSEDCLTVNIWSPDTDGHAPVLVWIHGGAFMYGSGTGSWTDGTAHAKNSNIVVVSLNYRLGILGGLFLDDIEPGSANFGLLDAVAALRWVRDNIAAFGGDPGNVTIAGQSAGAFAVGALLTSPPARGLFHRAIVESGHVGAGVSPQDAIANRDVVVGQLGLNPEDPDLMDKLRRVSVLRLLAVQRANGLSARAFPLVQDGRSIVSDPLGAIRSGYSAGVDLLVGTNTEEDRLFDLTGWTADPGMSLLDDLAQSVADPADLARACELYSADDGLSDLDRRHLFATDRGWGMPCRELALAHAEAGNRVFHYEFGWRSPAMEGKVGAAHLVELPFVFGNLRAPGVPALLGDDIARNPETLALSAAMASAWGMFITQGDPNPSPLPDWPMFSGASRYTMVIDELSQVEKDRNAVRLDFWLSVYAGRQPEIVAQATD